MPAWIVSHSVNGFFCPICQKNTWNEVARLGQHLLAQLSPWLVHPLLLSSSNYLFHETFSLMRYDENISYSENWILPFLPVEEEKWMLFGHWLHFNVCKPLQVWEIIFCAMCQYSAKALQHTKFSNFIFLSLKSRWWTLPIIFFSKLYTIWEMFLYDGYKINVKQCFTNYYLVASLS